MLILGIMVFSLVFFICTKVLIFGYKVFVLEYSQVAKDSVNFSVFCDWEGDL